MSKIIKLGKDYIHFHYFPHLLVTLVFCLISGEFVGFANLDAIQSAKVMEMYVSFVGILLITPLFIPEQDKAIWQLEQARETPMWQLYLIRLLLAFISVVVIVTIFLVVMQQSGSEIYIIKMWCGSVSEIMFLGAVGYFVSAVTNQVVLGYMAGIGYYLINTGKRFFSKFSLFRMQTGKYDFILWMSVGAIVLIVSGIMIRERKR